jgi:PIN domain nuclease of toxin-antitoxin system
LLDTNAWSWTIGSDPRLSLAAAQFIAGCDVIYVSPISIYEIGQKVRIGKWPEMAEFVHDLPTILVNQGSKVATLTPEISLLAAVLDWTQKDPFDRLLAATAIDLGVPLVSADFVFETLPRQKGWKGRIW